MTWSVRLTRTNLEVSNVRKIMIAMAVAAVLAAGCASDATDGDGTLPPTEDGNSDATETPIDPGDGIGDGSGGDDRPVVSDDLTSEVERAIADLTERLGAGATIEVVVAHELTWPDGSLGCPEPGMSYTQALVDGYRIELTDGQRTYDYHGANGGDPFLCDKAGLDTPEGGGNRIPPTTSP
jgi:hypothetical protein